VQSAPDIYLKAVEKGGEGYPWGPDGWFPGVAAEAGFRTHFCIISETFQKGCGFAFEG
jgi:hypothetical protein